MTAKFFLGLFMLAWSNLTFAVIVVPYIESAPPAPSGDYVEFGDEDWLAEFGMAAVQTRIQVTMEIRFEELTALGFHDVVSFAADSLYFQGDTLKWSGGSFTPSHYSQITPSSSLWNYVIGDEVTMVYSLDANVPSNLPGGVSGILTMDGVAIMTATDVLSITTANELAVFAKNGGSSGFNVDARRVTLEHAVGVGDPLVTIFDHSGDLASWNALPEMNGTVTVPD